tara:strand:+ start:833 stop:1021 length:189 start_codon:yes stop_codon:yes gene_type:complete
MAVMLQQGYHVVFGGTFEKQIGGGLKHLYSSYAFSNVENQRKHVKKNEEDLVKYYGLLRVCS